jgi:cytochrome c oxidase subunit 2
MTPAPAALEAALTHELGLVLGWGALVLFTGVCVLLGLSVRRGAKAPPRTARWVIGGGVVLPVVVLSVLLTYSTARTAALERAAAAPALVVSLTGHLWWWEVRYRDPATGRDVALANEIRVPVGRTTRLGLASADVIHSVWVPALGGKRDLVPGRTTHLSITPTAPGEHRGACAEFCGPQHAKMALHVVAMPAAEFDAWLAEQARPAAADGTDATIEAGRQAFAAHGCANCHAVRGTFEPPPRGPDLTHVASRLALGAGTLPNGPGAAKRWLVGVQELKPGARMPSYAHLDGATLDALSAYLESLR